MKLLGELEIELSGSKHLLKPTFKGLVVTEELSGRTLNELLRLFLSSKAGIKDVTAVIYGGMLGKNGDKAPAMSYDEIGEAVMHTGFHNLLTPCITLVGSAYSGKPIDETVKMREAAKALVEEPEKKTEPAQA